MKFKNAKRLMAITTSVLTLTACSDEDGQKIEEVQALVQDQLKDPQSAQFTNVRVVEGLVCGEVNAKNSFGGYIGKRKFWGGRPEVTAGQPVVISDDAETPCDLLSTERQRSRILDRRTSASDTERTLAQRA